jgi:type II secretory pathway component PulK
MKKKWLHHRRPAFLLVLVMLVIAMASLAMLNFSRSMLISNETSQISNGRLQARCCAESGLQSVRLLLARPHSEREAMGGTWANPSFQARNVVPHVWPQKRGNYTIISPGLDERGVYGGIRYGLQNESAKVNLNALLQLDQLAKTGALAPPETENDGTDQSIMLPRSGIDGGSAATNMLLALPGMTPDVADAILDWIDSDDVARDYGAESDFYARLQPAYSPANGPLESIEQLLLVRGVTPELLFGYDENRNGFLDPGEIERFNMGMRPGALPGQVNPAALDPNYVPPPPLGLAAYLTVHSREKNLARDGTPRININSEDLQTLYSDLQAALGNAQWASFIVAYRMGGSLSNPSGNPLNMLANLAAGQGLTIDPASSGGTGPPATANPNENLAQATAWSPEILSEFDLSAGGRVQFQQVLDLYDATVTIGEGPQARVFTSPLSSSPSEMATSSPILMDRLTTVSSEAIPGRINIMECPREVMMGIPGFTEPVVDLIVAARSDGMQSEVRSFETWLVVEGILTLDEMRGILPFVTCGGDVYRAQIVGYLEGEAAFSRIEAVVDGAGSVPEVRFFRRLDHLGRGFSIPTLGQRPDASFLFGGRTP